MDSTRPHLDPRDLCRQTWWQVPPVARVVLEGQLKEGVSGKDVIIALCGHFNQDEVGSSLRLE